MLTKTDLIEALQPINDRLTALEQGQTQILKEQKLLGLRQSSLESGQKQLESRQKQLESGQKQLEKGQKDLKKQVTSVELKVELINKNLNQSTKDNADFFHQTWAYIDEIKNLLDQRIKKIEDHLAHTHN